MFLEKEKWVELEDLKKYGIEIIYTKENFGNVLDYDKNELLDLLNLKNKILISGHQTHSANVQIVDELEKTYFENCDGFVTSDKKAVLFTKYADCLPIFLYDKNKDIIGVVHSGWQGSFKKIVINALEKMKNRFSSDKKDIVVAFGIGISKNFYEVQKDFYNRFKENFSDSILDSSFFFTENKIFFDNQLFNKKLLLEYGILEENIIANTLCTFSQNFHSYRRDKEKSGRNGAFIFFSK